MSTIRNPVGPQPPSVYWRRRLLLALGLVAVVIVIILIVVRPGAGKPVGAPTSSPATTAGASPSFPSTPGAGGNATACDPSVVTLVPVSDAASYAAGVQPQLSMTITNSGASACSFDVGTDAQVYVITSGADQIWSSKDCQTGATANVQVLQPGKAMSTTPFAWDRTRSSTSTCSTNRPEVTAGGASYHLAVQVGTAKSADTKQFLLK